MTAREQLTAWVRQQHAGQLIRETDQPYFDHLLRVAVMAGEYAILGYEVGLCHDLLEKTLVTTDQLHFVLVDFGYPDGEAWIIVDGVIELTDVFTKAVYPGFKKKKLKKREAKRLASISPLAQTVKYADLADNIQWMHLHRPEKTPAYLAKKQQLLLIMNKGNAELQAKIRILVETQDC